MKVVFDILEAFSNTPCFLTNTKCFSVSTGRTNWARLRGSMYSHSSNRFNTLSEVIAGMTRLENTSLKITTSNGGSTGRSMKAPPNTSLLRFGNVSLSAVSICTVSTCCCE